MNKNDVIATLASIGLILGLFGVLWILGHYPLVVVFLCVGILVWGLFKATKSIIKDYLESRDTSKGCKEKVDGVCPHHNLHCAYPECEE